MDKTGRRADVTIRLSEFELPPMQDVLLIGRRAPIGLEAARRMVDALAPDQYEICPVEHRSVEAIVARRRLFDLMPRERLIDLLLDEAERLSPDSLVIKGQMSIDLVIRKQVTLE